MATQITANNTPLEPTPLEPTQLEPTALELALLGIATIKAIHCKSETATRQLMREISGLDDKVAVKLMSKIHYALDWQSRQWLKQTIMPGATQETPQEAAHRIYGRISKITREN